MLGLVHTRKTRLATAVLVLSGNTLATLECLSALEIATLFQGNRFSSINTEKPTKILVGQTVAIVSGGTTGIEYLALFCIPILDLV
jgi:hypothetical protein